MHMVLEDLERVVYGLKVMVVGLALSVFSVAATMACAVYYMSDLLAGNGVFPEVPNYVLTFLSLLSSAVAIVGKVYCLRAPEESRAGGLIFASLLFSGVGMVIQIGSQIQGLSDSLRPIAPAAGMFVIFGFLMFLAFLRRIAEFINAPALASAAGWIQGATMAALALILVGAMMSLQAGGASAGGAILLLAGVGLSIVLYARYAVLLVRLRRGIEHQIGLMYEREGDRD